MQITYLLFSCDNGIGTKLENILRCIWKYLEIKYHEVYILNASVFLFYSFDFGVM